MQKISRIVKFIDGVSDNIGKVVGFLLLALTLILCWEVVLRSMFTAPTIWVHELSQYFFGALFMLGGAYCLRWKAMVNVDIIINRLRPRARAILTMCTAIFFFVFMFVLIIKGINMAIWSVKIGEATQTYWGPPFYPFKILVPTGAILMLMQGSAEFIRNSVLAITGKELP